MSVRIGEEEVFVLGEGVAQADSARQAWALGVAEGRVVADVIEGKPALIMERRDFVEIGHE